MRLVGVSRLDGDRGQVDRPAGVDARNKPPEPQDPVQHPRAVADRSLAPPAQLALADPELPGDQFGPGARPAEQPGGLEHQPVRRPLGHHLRGDRRDPPHGLLRRQRPGQPPPRHPGQVVRVHPLVEHLAERHAERRSPGPGPEPRAHKHCARPPFGRRRPGVRSRHEGPDAALPDQVGARVGQHLHGFRLASRRHRDPQAVESRPERHARCELCVPRRQIHGTSLSLVSESFKPVIGVVWSDGAMSKPDLDMAGQFIAANARVLDRRRFERLFGGGDAAPVRDAIAAYRNADGGFGQGLEPDGRDPATQPAAIELALRILDEADAWDGGLVAGACDWLQANAPAEGGSASLVSTGQIAGTLHARGVGHPWLDRATELMWSRIESLSGEPGPYDMYGVVSFLDHVPDRDRAERALQAVAPMLLKVVTLDPDTPGETHSPLGYAPRPDSLARRLFDKPVIEAHLDHLAAEQGDDGGWMFNWPSWSPAAELDWRGFITVSSLATLRDNGRL